MSTGPHYTYTPPDNHPPPPTDSVVYSPKSPPCCSPVPETGRPYIAPGRPLGTWGQEIAEHGMTAYTMHPGSGRFQPDEPIAKGRVLGTWADEIAEHGMTTYTMHPGGRFQSDRPTASQPTSPTLSPTASPRVRREYSPTAP
ncbi:hypothetical protein T484DRAFT_1755058 [Baffinella frigidus]|nr:hypothetical protein T484DRAFT_1755058 [Cryptophyta sp. CCMP2293]